MKITGTRLGQERGTRAKGNPGAGAGNSRASAKSDLQLSFRY